jgi:uncharacterized protein (AIM24 family)
VMTPEVPGQIIDLPLVEGSSLICQKGSLLCAEGSVEIVPFFQQKMPGYGSEGFILQQLNGPGLVFPFATGEARQYELKQGEVIKCDPAHIVCFLPSMNVDFSGEMAILGGPGKVWFQTMAMSYLSSLVGQYKSGR